MIQLPNNFASDVASSSTSTIAGLSPFVTLILGVLLAALVISVIIGAIHGRGH